MRLPSFGLAALALLPFLPPAVAAEPRTDRYGDPLPADAVARLGTTRLHHANYVWSVAFAPDGMTVASAGLDDVIHVWDTATGKERVQFAGHADSVRSVAFAPDGKLVASADNRQNMCLWESATGNELR